MKYSINNPSLKFRICKFSLPKKVPTTTPTKKLPYLVKITANILNIKSGLSTNYKIVGTIKKGEVYTILKKSGNWGYLKSGAGWIHLGYTQKYVKKIRRSYVS